MSALWPRASRWVALALLLLLIALPLLALAIAARTLEQATATRAALDEQRATLERIAARAPDLAARRDALSQSVGQGERFLAAATPALAGADLQGLVGTVAGDAGAQIDNVAVLPARQEGLYARVGLRVALVTAIGPLRTILHDLEAGPPSLFIDALQIQVQDPGAPEPALSVSFEVYGYMPTAAVP